jgi:hypothetical protein
MLDATGNGDCLDNGDWLREDHDSKWCLAAEDRIIGK